MIDKFGRTELGRYFYDPSSAVTLTGDLYVRTDGNSTITADLDYNSHKIINLGEPTNSHDAATKNYVDTHASGGSSIGTADLDLNFHKAINLNEPTQLHDAATKNYVDVSSSQCVKTDGSSTITGIIDMNSHKVINVSDPTALKDAANKGYVDTKVAYNNISYVDINMTAHKLTNLAEPTSSSDSATKNYVDTHASTTVGTADLNLNSHKLINVLDPSSAQDGTTKNYVDLLLQKSSLTSVIPGSGFTSLGFKSQTVAALTTSPVFAFSGKSGVLRRLWLALYSASGTNVPGQVFIRIFTDGEINVGNYVEVTDGIGVDQTGLATDLLFSPLGGAFYANSLQGCNMFNTTSLGGYFTLDMPFRNDISIQLVNRNATAITYWIQPFISTLASIPATIPLYKLYCRTFRYMNTTYGSEYVLLNTNGKGNGVSLKYIRMHIIGASGNWWESRVRMYDGNLPPGNGTVLTPWTPYNTNNYTYFPGYDGDSTCFFSSSGLEDFYLSSWNGSNVTSFNNKSTGLLYQSTSSIGSTTTISFYRNFGEADSMPTVAAGRRLVVTLNSGDAQVGQSGSFYLLLGQVYYYA